MKKQFALLILFCLTANVFALNFSVNNIWYTVTSSTDPYTVTVSGSGSPNGAVNIPSTVSYGSTTYTVTSIANGVFMQNAGMTSITLPPTIKSIGSNAFSVCENLQTITLPESVTSIGSNVFNYCKNLSSITLPSGLTSIPDYTFQACTALTSITIPKNVQFISKIAFTDCSNLSEVKVESGSSFFKSIDGVLFNADGTQLEFFPFANNNQKYVVPDGVITIGDEAFKHCSRLLEISFPTTTTKIGKNAFANCTELGNLTIPPSVTTLGDYAFMGCSNLYSLTMSGVYSSLGADVFSGVYNIQNLFCSGTSDAKALLNYAYIKALYILEGTKSIEYSAFSGFTKLESITIPSSVTYIGVYAFGMCTSLKNIYLDMVSPIKINSNVFFAANIDACKLYVPIGSYSSYRNASNWGDFVNIIERTPVAIKEASSTKLTVYSDRNSILIKGAKQGERLDIYSSLGMLVKSAMMNGDELRIDLPLKGMFIIKSSDALIKIVL